MDAFKIEPRLGPGKGGLADWEGQQERDKLGIWSKFPLFFLNLTPFNNWLKKPSPFGETVGHK